MPESLPLASGSPSVAPPSLSARLWPGWVILGLMGGAFGISVTPSINNFVRFAYMMLGPLVCAVLGATWTLFFSRRSWNERLTVTGMAIISGGLAWLLSVAGSGVGIWVHGVPLMIAAVILGESLGIWSTETRRIRLIGGLLVLAVGWFPLVRNEGFRGDYLPEYVWRWTPTKESVLAPARAAAFDSLQPLEILASTWTVSDTDWPSFRGHQLQSRAAGVMTPQNWDERPPRVLWKQAIGPGWSSFASVAGKLFTQEQRSEQEVTACYEAATGKIIWQSVTPTRFSDVVAGAGPRATPTFDKGQLFTLGARGLLTSLDAANGRVLWQRDLMKEVEAQLPVWGFSGSPVVMGQSVIVYAGGTGNNGLLAVDRVTGRTLWGIPSKGMNFSSAQPVTIDDTPMVVFGGEKEIGLLAVDPTTGKTLWTFRPSEWQGPPICQPQQIDDHSLIVTLGDGIGVARIDVRLTSGAWTVEEKWSSNQLKPSFNDHVYHRGYLYGFDQNIMVCLDAATGQRQWKKGRYGFGQLLLLPQTDQIIVQAEQGECIVVAADPQTHREQGRLNVISGKTWNHPIIANQTLYIRNGEEAAALDLHAESAP
ncbi:MAG: hypothetical protein DWH91_02075 [Planctomycetota bacterium]|nr:MAG: hypothetical protein DWH91_02075 [Planctomycetota bacterium]